MQEEQGEADVAAAEAKDKPTDGRKIKGKRVAKYLRRTGSDSPAEEESSEEEEVKPHCATLHTRAVLRLSPTQWLLALLLLLLLQQPSSKPSGAAATILLFVALSSPALCVSVLLFVG